MRDLVIAGGGPVGLATALYATRAGLDVVVHEPRVGIIDKACGEGLMPGAVRALADLGIDPPGQNLAGIRYLDGDTTVEAAFADGPGKGVRRTALHYALRTAVAAAGVPVEQRPVTAITQADDHVVVDGIPVRYLVAADGLHSPTRRALGLETTASGRRRYGLRAHAEVAPWTDHVEVHWGGAAEAYVTPVGQGLVGVALLTTTRAPFDAQLAPFKDLRRRLAGLDLAPVRGAGPLLQRSTARVAGRVLLVGDASGYVDALTGEGIALGLAQARAAVTAIGADTPQAYERDWRRITWRYRLLTSALLGATRRAPVRRRLVPAAAALPSVFAAAVNELARPA